MVEDKLHYFSVIIAAYNEEKYIHDCIKALHNQDYLGDFEIIVVDNNSNDNTSEIAKGLGATVFFESKQGVSHALIAGASHAKGHILAFTDADTRLPESWLSQINKVFNLHENVVAAGGIPLYYDGPLWANIFLHKVLKRFYIKYLKDSQQGLAGCNMAVRRDVYDKVGGFVPGYNWGQDWKMGKKASAHGEVIFDPEIFAHTSFRRFYGNHRHPLLKNIRAVKEIIVTAIRMIPMAAFDKNLKAQKPIR
jgi:glycosyltransferase involved in cell wall biosynthesis